MIVFLDPKTVESSWFALVYVAGGLGLILLMALFANKFGGS